MDQIFSQRFMSINPSIKVSNSALPNFLTLWSVKDIITLKAFLKYKFLSVIYI